MNPAKDIIGRLGGEAQVAFITGTALTAPYRWQAPRTRGGSGGLIPQRHHRALLDYARSKGIALTAEEFLPAAGARSPEIEAGRTAGAKRTSGDAPQSWIPDWALRVVRD